MFRQYLKDDVSKGRFHRLVLDFYNGLRTNYKKNVYQLKGLVRQVSVFC